MVYVLVSSNVSPGGQEQVKLPSVFTHVPPPLQMSGFRSHSLMSTHVFPSILAYPLGHSHSFLLHLSHGEPQATPIEQQHSDLRLSWGKLFSQRPLLRVVQQEPLRLSEKTENIQECLQTPQRDKSFWTARKIYEPTECPQNFQNVRYRFE